MSTDASRLYAGKNTMTPVGEILRKMVREGRVVGRNQKMRWQENREFYRGNQWVHTNMGSSQVQQMARNNTGPIAQMDFNSYNRLREYTDSRTVLLTKQRAAFDVIPEDNDQDSIDASRQAEKFLTAKWGRTGWNISTTLTELARNGDIDGVSWLYVDWDASEGDEVNQQIAVKADGTPITDRNEYEALKEEDPNQQSLWKMIQSEKPLGDVCWRVVLPGAISVDPFAISSFDDSRWVFESRVRPREEIEDRMGMSFKDAVKSQTQSAVGASNVSDVQYEDINVDDGSGGPSTVNESRGVVVHYGYIKPCADWPKGAHVEFPDKAPSQMLLAEEWDDELPYYCFIPRPDPGHFLRSRGVVDDLKPIQRDFNQVLRWVRQWMRKVALAPIVMPIGSTRDQDIYNESGYIEVHSPLGEPHMFNTPSEPTAILTNNLEWMTSQMMRISGISSYAQGFVDPGGPRSSMAISSMIQQTEQNMTMVENALVEAIEWGCNRAMDLVKENYNLARQVVSVGVDDAEQFNAFVGSQLRGSGRMRVTAPLTPKSNALRMNSIAQFAPILGDKILPYISGLIDGDPTELQTDVEIDRSHQKQETREMVGLVTDPTAQKVYANFKSDKDAFSQAFNIAVKSGQDPTQVLGQQGIVPPQLTPAMSSAGVKVPLVEDFHNHAMELKALDDFRKGDGYRRIEEMAKQLLREHADAHKKAMQQQIQAMAQQQPMGTQQGSAPSPKGTPSPPAQPATQGAH